MITHKEERKGWTGLASKACSVGWNRETSEKITGLKGLHPKNIHTKKEVPRGPKCD